MAASRLGGSARGLYMHQFVNRLVRSTLSVRITEVAGEQLSYQVAEYARAVERRAS
jgi:hypothetical protein